MNALVSINAHSEVWGENDELLDGTARFAVGQYHVRTFRGKCASARILGDALNDVARQLGYDGASLVTKG